jgi:hypothetical protein
VKRWKKIYGWPNYSVSTLGEVRNDNTGRILKHQKSKRGGYYPFVNLYKNGKRKNMLVHFLVATAFLGKRPVGYHIDHDDSDVSNPALSNLKYLTIKENMAKRRRNR